MSLPSRCPQPERMTPIRLAMPRRTYHGAGTNAPAPSPSPGRRTGPRSCSKLYLKRMIDVAEARTSTSPAAAGQITSRTLRGTGGH
jgi:hypothetical protein